MTFYIYDFNEYFEDITLISDDYETEIRVDLSDTWNADTESWDEKQGRIKAEKAVSAAYPGATLEWCYI